MGIQHRSAGYIGTMSDYWVQTPSPVYYGVWTPNEVWRYQNEENPAIGMNWWSGPGTIPSQEVIQTYLYGGNAPAGAGPGSITVPTGCPHIYVFCAGGGGGGGVDHDNGQARSGGSGGSRYALIERSAVANSGQTTMNYNVGNGGNGAPARSNDGNGGSGNASSVTFGNFNITANGGGGGCGKCGSNGGSGNTSVNGTVEFGGNGGGQSNWMMYNPTVPIIFEPVLNIPVTSAPANFSNPGGSNNGGGQGGAGGSGGLYVRMGRGINSSTLPGPGPDYGHTQPAYKVPANAKLLSN